ncbi:MAG: hypothetical protein LBU32_30235 [Clostridiales bacterium]|nr:hypothetical protein [Clostridiales bacterium]
MSIDIAFKCSGNRANVKSRLEKYIYSEDERFNEITLNFFGKWIWLYFERDYNEERTEFLSVKMSKDFANAKGDMKIFIDEMQDMGFPLHVY